MDVFSNLLDLPNPSGKELIQKNIKGRKRDLFRLEVEWSILHSSYRSYTNCRPVERVKNSLKPPTGGAMTSEECRYPVVTHDAFYQEKHAGPSSSSSLLFVATAVPYRRGTNVY